MRNHICPVCREQYDCKCPPNMFIRPSRRRDNKDQPEADNHIWFAPCSPGCKAVMEALERWLKHKGFGCS